MPTLNVVALLVVDRDSAVFANLRRNQQAWDIYIRCGALLAKSAHAAGYTITIATNEADLVRNRFAQLGVTGPTRVEQHNFVSKLEATVLHRSAHHKLDLLRRFAERADDSISMLVDLDVVFLRGLRHDELPRSDQIGCYDITPMMAAESSGRSHEDIRHLTHRFTDAPPRWFGGEVIAANADRFRELVHFLDEVEPRYWRLQPRLYHSGDEAPVSSALNLYLQRGGRIAEMGNRGAILRWWTARRPFRQPDLSASTDRAMLHLPADKEFLASMADKPFSTDGFLAAYRRYARPKLFSRRLKSLALHRALQGRHDYVARL